MDYYFEESQNLKFELLVGHIVVNLFAFSSLDFHLELLDALCYFLDYLKICSAFVELLLNSKLSYVAFEAHYFYALDAFM